MDKKPTTRQQTSVSFLGDHNIKILRKSLQHVRKIEQRPMDHSAQLRRNNSLNSKHLPNVNHPPSINPRPGSMNKPSENLEKNIKLIRSNTSRMLLSSYTSNFQEKLMGVKIKGAEQIAFVANKQNNPISDPNHMRIEPKKGKSQLIPFKQGKLIKILSSEKLRTPKKEERSSWNSKKDRDTSNSKKKESHPSFFLIKSKPKIFNKFAEDYKENQGKSLIENMGIPKGESFYLENNDVSMNKETKGKKIVEVRKSAKEAHQKINDLLTNIVEKAAQEEEQKK